MLHLDKSPPIRNPASWLSHFILKKTPEDFGQKNFYRICYCHPSLDKKHGPLSPSYIFKNAARGARWCGHKVGIASQMRKKLLLREEEESQLNSLGILRIRESCFQILNQSVEVALDISMSQIVFSVGGCFTSWGATQKRSNFKLKYGVWETNFLSRFCLLLSLIMSTSLAFNEHFLQLFFA